MRLTPKYPEKSPVVRDSEKGEIAVKSQRSAREEGEVDVVEG